MKNSRVEKSGNNFKLTKTSRKTWKLLRVFSIVLCGIGRWIWLHVLAYFRTTQTTSELIQAFSCPILTNFLVRERKLCKFHSKSFFLADATELFVSTWIHWSSTESSAQLKNAMLGKTKEKLVRFKTFMRLLLETKDKFVQRRKLQIANLVINHWNDWK